MKNIINSLLIFLVSFSCVSQEFTRQDELRGSITPEREWWDLRHYDLRVEVFPEERLISGSNIIKYRSLYRYNIMQIDLQLPMKIDSVKQDDQKLKFETEGHAHFIELNKKQKAGKDYELTIYFSGKPIEAKNAPWDGGFSWTMDSNGKHFIATSNQGIGASVWWPNKDHYYDEPEEGVKMSITVPKHLMNVSNGRLIETVDNGETKTWIWNVVNPINNYGVNINIGDYVSFSEEYEGLKGTLDMDYYVLRDNLEKAKEQFKQAPLMMEAFEHWFGPYPFYEDSFKLVEVPYLGMEHQSSVTYGNNYENGYLGKDLSRSGWGLKFDFIIIHEAGHEWFANNITHVDVADMWIHEGFTAYSENLYLDYHFGEKASSEYVLGTRRLVQNNTPIIGTYNVNKKGSNDMYTKGANLLHSLRQIINDDEKWRTILTGLNKDFYHQTVSSKQVEEYISEKSGLDLSSFWNQYLRTIKIPNIEYNVSGKILKYRYTNIVDGFELPLILIINGKEEWIIPSSEWQTKEFSTDLKTVLIKRDFYVEGKRVEY